MSDDMMVRFEHPDTVIIRFNAKHVVSLEAALRLALYYLEKRHPPQEVLGTMITLYEMWRKTLDFVEDAARDRK